MQHNIMIIYLIAHVIGDYYLQNEKMAESKNKALSSLLIHSAIYMAIMVLVVIPVNDQWVVADAILIGSIHLLIDVIKFILHRIADSSKKSAFKLSLKKWLDKGTVYALDQVLHIVTILIVSTICINNRFVYTIDVFRDMDLDILNQWLRIALMVLVLLKPVNVTFKKMFSTVRPVMEEQGQFLGERSVGKIIGNLERLLMMLLLIAGQYGAIGLVFTGKSITRYNKITEDKAFGEYYLLGTLFSILSTVAVYMLVF